MYKLFARTGWGSTLVEAQLAWYGLPYTIEEVGDLFQSAEAREKLAAVNPVAQVPTLVLPDGQVMTESAAITLYLADLTARTDLVPGPKEAERAAFLRWLVFLVANVYPTFTYADDPSRFVEGKEAQKPFRKAIDAYAQKLYRQLEAEAGAPWFLGQRMTALDLYLSVMTRWRPQRAWFAEHCPKLLACATRMDAQPDCTAVLARNFPEKG